MLLLFGTCFLGGLMYHIMHLVEWHAALVLDPSTLLLWVIVTEGGHDSRSPMFVAAKLGIPTYNTVARIRESHRNHLYATCRRRHVSRVEPSSLSWCPGPQREKSTARTREIQGKTRRLLISWRKSWSKACSAEGFRLVHSGLYGSQVLLVVPSFALRLWIYHTFYW